jgi:hypothetical protein
MLAGAPIMHVALPEGRHNVYDHIPKSFEKLDFSFVSRLAESWNKRMFGGVGIKKFDFSHTSSPRLTNQGILLRGVRETPGLRFIRKAVQAKLATLYRHASQVEAFYKRLDALAVSYGFDFSFRSFVTGIRRQQVRKPEPIQDKAVGYPVNRVKGYSLGLQGRIRGIFMPPELTKIFRKPVGDILKATLFEKHPVFKVDPSHVGSFLTRLAAKHRELAGDKFEEEGTLVAYDLSAYDTTQHKGLYDLYQNFMSLLVDDFDESYGKEFIAGHQLLTSTGVSRTSPVVEFHPGGFSKLSGEPEVTISNNVIAYLVFLRAWATVLNVDPVDLDTELFNEQGDRFAKIHGDDAGAYMSSDPEDYRKFKEVYELSGLKLEFEQIPAYLKKTDSSNFKGKDGKYLKPGTIYGVPGSILKNRFGEYPRSNASVIVAGLMDTLTLIPKDTKYYDMYADFAEMILEHVTPWKSISAAEAYYRSPAFIEDMTEYARSSIVKASEVKSILDRHFYSNGEMFDEGSLAEIYGSLEYKISDLDDLALPSTIEELEDLIIAEQSTLFESDGTRTILSEYISEAA